MKPSFHDSPGMLLRGAYLTMHRQFNAHFKAHGVTADQFVLLSLLHENGGCTQQRLAELCCSDANTVGAMLRLLAEKGLVIRRPHPADRRAVVVQLSGAGRALRGLCEHSARALHGRLHACIPLENREGFFAALREIARSMGVVVSALEAEPGPVALRRTRTAA